MKIAVMDEDFFVLEDTLEMIKKERPRDEVVGFDDGLDLLEYLSVSPCELLFIEPHMETMDGIVLVREIKETIPRMNIVFVTAQDSYYRNAMELRASGYVLKPLRPIDVRREMKELRYQNFTDTDKLLEVTCFGKFTVLDKDRMPVRFERSKARELFAYLIHKKGGECTIREAAAVLFEDDPFDDKKQNYMQKIISSMMKSLRSCGAEQVICKEFNSLSVDVDKVSCDYYRYIALGGDKVMMGDETYMQQYTWADYW